MSSCLQFHISREISSPAETRRQGIPSIKSRKTPSWHKIYEMLSSENYCTFLVCPALAIPDTCRMKRIFPSNAWECRYTLRNLPLSAIENKLHDIWFIGFSPSSRCPKMCADSLCSVIVLCWLPLLSYLVIKRKIIKGWIPKVFENIYIS